MHATTGTHKDLRFIFPFLDCQGVADSPYQVGSRYYLIYNKLQNFISQKLIKLFERNYRICGINTLRFDLSNLWNKQSLLRLDLSDLWNKQNSLRFDLSKV
jgi:hypothetical protein